MENTYSTTENPTKMGCENDVSQFYMRETLNGN